MTIKPSFLEIILFLLASTLALCFLIIPSGALYLGHSQFLTPHHLAVSHNLQYINFLCNDINWSDRSCTESYHRHPPLYFYLNYLITFIDNTKYGFIDMTRMMSMLVNALGLIVLIKAISVNKNYLLVLTITLTTIGFFHFLALSSFDALTLLVTAGFIFSYRRKKYFFGATIFFLATVTSWYLILLATFQLVYLAFTKNIRFWYVLSYLTGICLTLSFVIFGNSDFAYNLDQALKNIENTSQSNSLHSREMSLPDLGFLLLKNIGLAFPISLIVIFCIDILNWRKGDSLILLRVVNKIEFVFFVPVLALLAWLMIFLTWSLIHGFVFMLAFPTLVYITMVYYWESNYQSKTKILLFLIFAFVVVLNTNFFINGFTNFEQLESKNNGIIRYQKIFER